MMDNLEKSNLIAALNALIAAQDKDIENAMVMKQQLLVLLHRFKEALK